MPRAATRAQAARSSKNKSQSSSDPPPAKKRRTQAPQRAAAKAAAPAAAAGAADIEADSDLSASFHSRSESQSSSESASAVESESESGSASEAYSASPSANGTKKKKSSTAPSKSRSKPAPTPASTSTSSDVPTYLADPMRFLHSYPVTVNEIGVLTVEPYKSMLLPLWRFKTEEIARESSQQLEERFATYGTQGDFVGMDMARKFIQMGMTRAKRYANYKGGRKYVKGEQLEKSQGHEGQNEKDRASLVFRKVWERCKADEVYNELKSEFLRERERVKGKGKGTGKK